MESYVTRTNFDLFESNLIKPNGILLKTIECWWFTTVNVDKYAYHSDWVIQSSCVNLNIDLSMSKWFNSNQHEVHYHSYCSTGARNSNIGLLCVGDYLNYPHWIRISANDSNRYRLIHWIYPVESSWKHIYSSTKYNLIVLENVVIWVGY